MSNYVTMIGVRKGQYRDKNGVMKNSFNYYGMKDFSARDFETMDCEGKIVVSEWSSINFNVHPGDVVRFVYEPGYQDRATLVDIEPVALAAGNPFPGDKAAESKDSKDKNKAGA